MNQKTEDRLPLVSCRVAYRTKLSDDQDLASFHSPNPMNLRIIKIKAKARDWKDVVYVKACNQSCNQSNDSADDLLRSQGEEPSG